MARGFGFKFEKGSNFDRELRRLEATPAEIEKVIREELITTATRIRNHIIRSMATTPRITRLKTSRTSNARHPSGNFNWMIGGKLHIPSSPGYAPAVAGGDFKKSIKMNIRQNEVEVGSNLSGKKGMYPEYLENGTKNMDARPWLEPAYEDEKREFFSTIRRRVLNAIGNTR
jgi:HK97 gp10 family phage protein